MENVCSGSSSPEQQASNFCTGGLHFLLPVAVNDFGLFTTELVEICLCAHIPGHIFVHAQSLFWCAANSHLDISSTTPKKLKNVLALYFVLSTQDIAGIFYTALNSNNTGHVLCPKSSHCRGHCEPLPSLLLKNAFASNKLYSVEYFQMPYSKQELTLVGVDINKAKDSDLRNEF